MGGHRPRLASLGGALLLVTVAFTALAVPASAQSPIQAQALLQADPGPETYTPGGPPDGGNWTLTVQTNAPPAESFTVNLAPTDVPEHWNVTLDPTSITFTPTENPDTETPQTYTANGTYTAKAGPNAPAFAPISATLEPSFDEATTMETEGHPTEITLTPGFRPEAHLTAQPANISLSPNGGTTTLSATLTNDGNGQARFDLTHLETPNGCEAAPLTPDSSTLGSQPTAHWTVDPGEQGTVELELDCGFTYDEGRVTLTASHAYAPDTSLEGDSVEAQWQVDHEGFGGWGMIFLLLVLVAIVAAGLYVYLDRDEEESLQAWAKRKREHIQG